MASTILALILLTIFSLTSADNAHYKRALELSQTLEPRVLKAAALHSDISRRSLHNAFTRDVSLHYVEDASQGSDPMAAHVSLRADKPTLILEHIHDLLTNITCTPESIMIQALPSAYPEIHRMLGQETEFYIMTSHETCNEQGSRLPHLVSSHQFFNETKSVELITKTVIDWREAYDVKVDYALDSRRYALNNHYLFKRGALRTRQITPRAVSLPANVDFPKGDTTTGVTQTIGVNNINTVFKNQPIIPLPGDIGHGISFKGIQAPDTSVALTCKECSITGKVTLSSGSFSSNAASTNAAGSSNPIGDAIDFSQNGFVSITADDLTGLIDISVTSTKDSAFASVSLPFILDTIPLQPISIPNLAVIGPLFEPELILTVTVAADLQLDYGFRMRVPSGSTAKANIGDLTKSTTTGFDQTTLDELPFKSNIANPNLNLSIALQPQVLVGISFLNGGVEAGAGVFLSLPAVTLSVEPVIGADANCNPGTNAAAIDGVSALLGDATRIVPEVVIAAGFVAKANIGVLTQARTFTQLATTLSLPTACLQHPRSAAAAAATPAGGLVPAGAAIAKATPLAKATPIAKVGTKASPVAGAKATPIAVANAATPDTGANALGLDTTGAGTAGIDATVAGIAGAGAATVDTTGAGAITGDTTGASALGIDTTGAGTAGIDATGADIAGAGAATVDTTSAGAATVDTTGAGAITGDTTGAGALGLGTAGTDTTGATVDATGAGAATLDTTGAGAATVDTTGAGALGLGTAGTDTTGATVDATGAGAATLDTTGVAAATVDTTGAGAATLDTTGAGAATLDTTGAGAATVDTIGAGAAGLDAGAGAIF